ncbi:alpha-1-antitrypsin homolog isoform X1 [Trachinotus anak]|uniref:alpha-1-antitrypsin homolog isoform X1 n=1 Tax=Trachinotus anak TaxID=443729 RepID=UPI0039F1A754
MLVLSSCCNFTPCLLQAVKMHGIFARCVLAAMLLAVTWADPHHHEGELSCHNLSSHHADFGFALYKSLNAKAAAGKNIFYSPLGISAALSMLSTGARGETHRQLFSSLGYSALNQTQVNDAYKCLFNRLGQNQEDQRLDVGSALAVPSGFSPQKFLKDVKHYYSSEIFNIDITRPHEAAAEINRFIANKTQNKIQNMVQNLDPDTVMVLINYVYFKGQWEKPFSLDLTHKADFHLDNTTRVRVDMMTRTGYYGITLDVVKHATVIMLPYKSKTSMMVVLPDEGKMTEVEGNVNKDQINHWRGSAFMTYARLSLPKFSISADASLEDTLKEMGITNAFEDHADFSGISEGVKVSKASHKATLSVTEMGTEAAAATILELMPLIMPVSVQIDRPFLVFILENSTGNILFMGKINNPMAM